jgi:hypothetical protein
MSSNTSDHHPRKDEEQYDAIVIGGGASGLMYASLAGKKGLRVLVLDHANKVGKKILMSGGGKCNFTNLHVEPENFICGNPHFVKSALSRYTQWDFIALVEKHSIPYHEREHGELFCDNSAKDVLNMLLDECVNGKAEIRTRCEVQSIERLDESKFALQTSLGNFACDKVIIATGGLSIPTMGATGFGYQIAEQFELEVLPRRAGLVPFTFSDQTKTLTEKLSGLAQEVSMFNPLANFKANMLFTHRGISGPAALQLSNYWNLGEYIGINLLPDIDLESYLIEEKNTYGNISLKKCLAKHFSKAFCYELEQMFWPDLGDKPMAGFSDHTLKEIAQSLSAWRLKPSGTEGYRKAEVTLGGVDTNEISSKTMECKHYRGLYFIGEVLDVTGHLGGFNFQWAWASANAASEAA